MIEDLTDESAEKIDRSLRADFCCFATSSVTANSIGPIFRMSPCRSCFCEFGEIRFQFTNVPSLLPSSVTNHSVPLKSVTGW